MCVRVLSQTHDVSHCSSWTIICVADATVEVCRVERPKVGQSQGNVEAIEHLVLLAASD